MSSFLETAVTNNWSRLVRRIWWRYGMDAPAEDILQDVVVRILEEKPDFYSSTDALRYVHVCISRVAIDNWRKKKNRGEAIFDLDQILDGGPSIEDFLITTTSSPADELASVFEQGGMEAALLWLRERIPDVPDHQWKILQFIAAGQSAQQVGDEVGMTANAVRVARSRLQKKIREYTYSRCEKWGGWRLPLKHGFSRTIVREQSL